MDITSFIIGYNQGKKSASGGGGSGDATVWFVSFMGADGSLLFKMPVLDGDDCKNPVTHGDITTPTKESTVQYNYTYSGWSLTEGGTADTTNALANVTEDRTVYAAFTSVVRYYTVTYYDSDGVTVLKTESLAYGTTPSYKPAKEGYTFGGWNPDTPVTGDTSYSAIWINKLDFGTCSWAKIAEVCASGSAADSFELGATKTIMFNGATATAKIVGFNHDDLADGSGKAPITLMIWGMNEWEAIKNWSPRIDNAWEYTNYKSSIVTNLETPYENGTLDLTKWDDGFPEMWKKVTKQNRYNKTLDEIFTIPSLTELGYTKTASGDNYRGHDGTRYAAFTSGKQINSATAVNISHAYEDIYIDHASYNGNLRQYATRSYGSNGSCYGITCNVDNRTGYTQDRKYYDAGFILLLLCIG